MNDQMHKRSSLAAFVSVTFVFAAAGAAPAGAQRSVECATAHTPVELQKSTYLTASDLARAYRSARVGGFHVQVVPGPALAANADALAAFQRAAEQWEAFFLDPVTVRIDADLAELDDHNVIGQTVPVSLLANGTDVRDALLADAAAEPDDGIVAFLPTSPSFRHPPGIYPSGALSGPKANFKALGFSGLDDKLGPSDATITFNSHFPFDYDNSDGLSPGTRDFESVAAHEIGHVLGFLSEADDVDSFLMDGTGGAYSPTPFDLFRFQDGGPEDPASRSDFAEFPRTVDVGDAVNLDTITRESALSTGRYNGDGRQPSHWKDDVFTGTRLGMMDPTFDYGEVFEITDNDLRVFDVIGYDIVLALGSTTTSTITTSSSTTTTSTTTSTSTTVPGSGLTSECNITFDAVTETLLGALTFNVDYANAPGRFKGSIDDVECISPQWIAAFIDRDDTSLLSAEILSQDGMAGRVATCVFETTGVPHPHVADFAVTVVDAHDILALPVLDAEVVVAVTNCANCGQPVTRGPQPMTTDCLYILKVAVGARECRPACICDTDGSGEILTTDALRCLHEAVGQPDSELECPC